MAATPDKDGRLLVGYFDYLNKENRMSTDPQDGGPTTDSREEKRVEVTETTTTPEPVKETTTETTETVVEREQ